MGKIIISPNEDDVQENLIYLAGPIFGAPDWQSDAVGLLGINDSVNVISPRQARDLSIPLSGKDEHAQICWEQKYLHRVMREGLVLFWFPKPQVGFLGEHYGRQSFFELGEVVSASLLNKASLVVGFEDGFSHKSYIHETLMAKMPDLLIATSLPELCDQTLLKIRLP